MFLLEATRGILPERVPVSLIAILAVWIILALPAVALSAAPEIFIQEEPGTYLVIDKLEGMGFLPGLMTGDRAGSGFPSRWAWMGGIFLPSIGAMKKTDLRIEFDDNIDFNSRSHHAGGGYQHCQYPTDTA